MAVIHIVLLSYKADASPEAIADANAGLLALKDTCLHPTTKTPYIKSVTGGTNINNAPESRNLGVTHGFTFEFNSHEDKAYYIKEDPAHQSLVAKLVPLVEKITGFDYETGKFE
ncbi:uncharacterized protein Triagg1_6124 [Trichoderma aggressivum f. europaeum]|uniref:Stress-response A/B barrel domain-containing protein n=1 Tax=Trichoderma aggressivum f. europaeum TaxID=173218 RepID=A0AAE1J874_9HYPO|nr:hypothetical protein Triagg1_6124 [Trichoderma aggressivum f. europaeum]